LESWMMATVSTKRAVEIFRQHGKRLKSHLGKERTEEGDLFVQALLPTLDSCCSRAQWELSARLGMNPAEKYHHEHPNKALRMLCDVMIQKVKSSIAKRVRVLDELTWTHCLTCQDCGSKFLAKRSDAKYCPGGNCQRQAHRKRIKLSPQALVGPTHRGNKLPQTPQI
jgi:hypothetical protein